MIDRIFCTQFETRKSSALVTLSRALVVAWGLFTHAYINAASSGVLEISGGVESGRFIDGVNLTDNALSVELSGEWSANNGAFGSLACFVNENSNQAALQRGCDAAVGWFTPINNQHALTFSVSRHDYSSPVLRDWKYTDASVSWHIGQDTRFELQASDSLLGRGFSSVTASFNVGRNLDRHWRINASLAVTSLQQAAPVETLEYGVIAMEYSRRRWLTSASVMLSSSTYQAFSNLNLDQPELAFNVRYRFY